MPRDSLTQRRLTSCAPLLLLLLLPGVLAAGDKPKTKQPARLLLLWHNPDGHPRTTHEYQAGMRIIAGQLQPADIAGLWQLPDLP